MNAEYIKAEDIKTELKTKINSLPFNIIFRDNEDSISITLKDNADVLKLAAVYRNILDTLNIKYTQEITGDPKL